MPHRDILREQLRCVGERPTATGYRRCNRAVRQDRDTVTLMEAMAGGPRYCDICTDEYLRMDDVLWQYAARQVEHADNGMCPDVDEPMDRDPQCVVCQALSLTAHPAKRAVPNASGKELANDPTTHGDDT